MRWDIVAVTFAALALAELGDKTQLVAMAMAVCSNPFVTFTASTLGFVMANLAAAALASLVLATFPLQLLGLVAGALFVASGIVSLVGKGGGGLKRCGFGKGVCLMLIAELGDKSNLVTAALVASTGSAAEVAVGLVAAAVFLMAIATALGSALSRALPKGALRRLSGVLFIAVGVLLLAHELLLP